MAYQIKLSVDVGDQGKNNKGWRSGHLLSGAPKLFRTSLPFYNWKLMKNLKAKWIRSNTICITLEQIHYLNSKLRINSYLNNLYGLQRLTNLKK